MITNLGQISGYKATPQIHDIKKIFSLDGARIFNKWVTKLQNQKNFNPSPLLLRIIKGLSNSLPGKHTDLPIQKDKL